MIPAKEFEGELWIKSADFHRQKKEWVGLTDEEINLIWEKSPHIVGLYTYTDIAKQVEAKLKEKNA